MFKYLSLLIVMSASHCSIEPNATQSLRPGETKLFKPDPAAISPSEFRHLALTLSVGDKPISINTNFMLELYRGSLDQNPEVKYSNYDLAQLQDSANCEEEIKTSSGSAGNDYLIFCDTSLNLLQFGKFNLKVENLGNFEASSANLIGEDAIEGRRFVSLTFY